MRNFSYTSLTFVVDNREAVAVSGVPTIAARTRNPVLLSVVTKYPVERRSAESLSALGRVPAIRALHRPTVTATASEVAARSSADRSTAQEQGFP